MFSYNLCIIFCKDDPRAKIFVGNLDWETKEGIYTFESLFGGKNSNGNSNGKNNNNNKQSKQANKPILLSLLGTYNYYVLQCDCNVVNDLHVIIFS